MRANQKHRHDYRAEIRAGYRPKQIDFARLEDGLPALCGNNFRLLRAEYHWTQAQAAGIMKVSVSQYRKYERGEDAPKFVRMIEYCAASGAPLAFFYCRSDYMPYLGEYRTRVLELPIFLFCGRASHTEFAAFAYQLSSRLGRVVQIPGRARGGPDPFREVAELPEDDYCNRIARNLRYLREVLALTQEEMAAAMGLAVRTYSQYERYDSAPRFCVNHVMRLWAATGIAPEWLFFGTPVFHRCRLQQERVRQVRQWLVGGATEDWHFVFHIARRNRQQVVESSVRPQQAAAVVGRF